MSIQAKDTVWAAPAKWASLITSESVNGGKPYAERPVRIMDGVAVIDISGVLLREEDEMCEMFGGASTIRISRQVREAVANAEVKSILLYVNSPGGQVNGTAELADQIYGARQVKPVHAYVSGDCFSAGYWLASQAQTITAHEAAGLGALGVCYPVGKDYSDWIISESTPNKFPEVAGEQSRAQMQSFLNELATIFMRHVARGRGTDEQTVAASYGRGDIFIAAQGVQKGLADAVGSFETALAAARNGAPAPELAGETEQETEQETEIEISIETENAIQNKTTEGEKMSKKITAEMVDSQEITLDWLKQNMPDLIDQIMQNAADEEAARQAEIDAMVPADDEEKMAIHAARKDRKITAAKLSYDLRIKAQAKAAAIVAAAAAARAADSAAVDMPINPSDKPKTEADKHTDGIIAAMKKRRGIA